MASENTTFSGNISVPYDGELEYGLSLLGLVYDGIYPRTFFACYIHERSGNSYWSCKDDGRGVGFKSIELKNGALNCAVTTYSSVMYICVVTPTDFPTT